MAQHTTSVLDDPSWMAALKDEVSGDIRAHDEERVALRRAAAERVVREHEVTERRGGGASLTARASKRQITGTLTLVTAVLSMALCAVARQGA